MALVVIVCYKCLIESIPDGGFDYKVIWIDAENPQKAQPVTDSLEPESYKNADGELVEWVFDQVIDYGELRDPKSGDEIVGFTGGDCGHQD
jgi:hypothetical protein